MWNHALIIATRIENFHHDNISMWSQSASLFFPFIRYDPSFIILYFHHTLLSLKKMQIYDLFKKTWLLGGTKWPKDGTKWFGTKWSWNKVAVIPLKLAWVETLAYRRDEICREYMCKTKDLNHPLHSLLPTRWDDTCPYTLRHKSDQLPADSMLKVYTSSVRFVLEYAMPVWQTIPSYLSDKIESMQKRVLRDP